MTLGITKRQAGVSTQALHADVEIFVVGTTIFAVARDGKIIDQGTFNTNDGRVFQSAANYFTDTAQTVLIHVKGYGNAKPYVLEQKISCNTVPVSWIGDGPNNTVIKLGNNVNDNMFDYSNAALTYIFINFIGLFLSGNKANQTAGSGIFLEGTFFDVLLLDVYIDGFKEFGFKQDTPFNTRIIGCVFEHMALNGAQIGTAVGGGSDVSISHSKFLSNTQHGLAVGVVGHGIGAFRLENCYIALNVQFGLVITDSSRTVIEGNVFEQNSFGNVGVSDHMTYNNTCSFGKVVGNSFIGSAVTRRAVTIASVNSNSIIIEANSMEGMTATPVSDAGTTSIIRHNQGFITESSGSATILSGTTAIAVNHGLSYTPSINDIQAQPQQNPTNAPGNIWISGVGATQFTINCANNPGASNFLLGWMIRRT